MRLIDADALKEHIKNTADLGGWIGEALYQIKQLAIKYIDSAPTIDAVSVVRGEWIKEGCAKGSEMCNQCGFVQFEGRVDNFCPNCGAKMKGADDEID